jgi:ribosomal protection tetracycline resistance protein
MKIEAIKNIGIFAHVDAGKTTLTEQLLYHTGAIKKAGRVDHGNTTTDALELERERGISILSTPTSYLYKNHKINIIDTPGHVDFVAEVERSMLVLDAAILVISAKEGVQSHTRLLFGALERMQVPVLLFVNKVDRMGVNIEKVLTEIRKQLSPHICVMQTVTDEGFKHATVSPVTITADDALIELLSQVDESVMMDYLDGKSLNQQYLHRMLRDAVTQRIVFPLLFGSALNGVGIEEILVEINTLLPSFQPLDTDEVSGVVFKVRRQYSKKNRLSTIKVTAGLAKMRGTIGEDKITNLYRYHHGELVQSDILTPGEIGVATGLHHLNVGDTFGQGIQHKGFSLGKPTLKVNVKAVSPTQRRELLEAMVLLTESDPYLSYELSEFNDDIYINLFGYVQMEIVQEWLKRDYGIPITFDDPMTIYMETPKKVAESYIGMKYFYAGVGLRIEPLSMGCGVQYTVETHVNGLKPSFQRAIEDGVYAYIDQGLHGWEITDMKVSLTGWDTDSIMSAAQDYRDLTPLVLFDALKQADTRLLWPMNSYSMYIPTFLMGRSMSDLQKMKATIDDPVLDGDGYRLSGTIPVDGSGNYDFQVHAYSSGMGYYESKFLGYEDAPPNVNKKRPKFKLDPADLAGYLLAKRKIV